MHIFFPYNRLFPSVTHQAQFHAVHLPWVEILSPNFMSMSDKHLYFGYGSNMDRADWAQWCSDHDADPSGLIEIGPAWLPDYTLQFHYFSTSRKAGAADVVPSTLGSIVPGLLFEVDDQTLRSIDIKEGLPYAYERRNVTVVDGNGRLRQAMTYTVQQHRCSEDYEQPHASYVELIQRNLMRNKLPIEHLNLAIDNMHDKTFLNGVFVYGTLRQGESRSSIMDEASEGLMEPASVRGTLYDHGAYPGLRAEGEGNVVGEFYRCKNITDTLRRLDEIEGFSSYDDHEGLYHRAVLKVKTKEGERWAWTYITNLSTSGENIIESGDWKNR